MPLFKYQCAKCGHVMEALEKAGATNRHSCEKCGNKHVEKMMSSFSVNSNAGSGSSCPTCSTGSCSLS